MQKKITHRGVDLHYEDEGSGEVVMLLHGFAEDSHIWETVKDAFAGYRLIIPDLPGSGRSALHQELSIESMAEAAAAILEMENAGNAIVIGHSMGGYVMLALVEKY